jgi:16S rRNA (guanine(966)-N(2))-methyltransferase RsmD
VFEGNLYQHENFRARIMRVKITTGLLKGMEIKCIKNKQSTRPTGAKARLAVMNTLSAEISGGVFWDGCAGYGSMGLEALSRGASGCVFIENNPEIFKILLDNISEAKRRYRAQGIMLPYIAAISQSWEVFISQTALGQPPPQVLWLDPPYDRVVGLLDVLAEKEFTSYFRASQGVFALEHATSDVAHLNFQKFFKNNWILWKQKTFGITSISFLKLN